MEDLLRITDISKILNMPKSTIYSWTKQNKIPHRKIHGTLRFVPTEIEQWLDSCCPPPRQVTLPKNLGLTSHSPVDSLIARAQREAYNASHGETRPKSSPKRKEESHGAL